MTRSDNGRKADAIKRELQRRGETYGDVAARAGLLVERLGVINDRRQVGVGDVRTGRDVGGAGRRRCQ